MMNIDEKAIKNLATDIATFKRGQLYFLQKRVIDLEIDYEHNMISATVEGQDNYTVEIEFDNGGEVDYHYCDCPAHYSYNGACKHVIAALFAANKRSSSPAVLKSNQKLYNEFIADYEYMNITAGLETARLDIILNVERYYNKLLTAMELRVGKNKTYVVKNIADFINKLHANESIEFGKNFTFSHDKYKLCDEDMNIIKLIKELYEQEKLQNALSPYSHTSNTSSFRSRKVYMSQPTLKRLLHMLENRSFSLTIGNEQFENIHIIKENFLLDLKLTKHSNNLKLSISKNSFTLLTEDGQYVLYNNHIYKIPENSMKYYAPALKRFSQDKSDMLFKNEESERFVSYVLPYLKKISNLTIAAEVEKSIIQSELNIKIYLDKEGSSITANIEFIYDDYVINPFISRDSYVQNNKILIRDMEAERTLLSYFEKDDFKVKNGVAHLENEDSIFDFVLLTLPKLQSMAEIYYSDAFKKISIKDSKAFSGGVRLNDTSNMLEFSFYHDDIAAEELIDVFAAIRLKKKYHRLKDGSFIPLEDGYMQSVAELINSLDITEKELKNKVVELPKFRAIYLDQQLKQLKLKHIDRSLYYKQLIQNITEPQDMEYTAPNEINTVMREYQKVGFKWLKTLAAYNMGGILADDMGLGKTLQTIAFIASNKSDASKPCMVIAPTSLIYNWQEEVYKFAPDMRVSVITGLPKQRQELIQAVESSDLIITSYPLIRRDAELYEDIKFDYCFIDEAQHIKNPESINAKSVKQIKAKGYFALTGTPIENSMSELWSIFDFIMPGYLLTHRKFVEKYERPIIKESDKRALESLSSQIRPFILRRLKKDVLKELPEKIETRMVAELSDEQKKIYLAYMQQAKSEVAMELKEKGFDKSQIKILSILTRLRQICCHPAMFIQNYKGDSGKLELLEELIEDALEGGHRILLFSQFTSMLKIIKNWLDIRHIDSLYLDGSTAVHQRGEMVKAFNSGEGSVFLISLKAGGTGLNLTGADTVIHFDPWWNPAVEDQATDRAHRIGQKNTVQVIKLITKGTIEEKVYALQQKKKHLIEALVQPGEAFVSKLSEDEIKALFDI